MEKKESYRNTLPHFQQPGQAYFVTWSLKDAIPPKALASYSKQLNLKILQIDIARKNGTTEVILAILKMEFYELRRKYIKAFDDLLDLQKEFIVNLSNDANRVVTLDTLCYWEGKRLDNYAICVMSNHVHWVFRLYEKDESGEPVYLQDVLQSVKRFSATKINKNEGLKGNLWQKESFDTTIRDDKHLYNAINYTINNPVKAGLVTDWKNWKGTMLFDR